MLEYDHVVAALLPIGALPLWRLARHAIKMAGEAGCHPEYAGQVFSRTLFWFDIAIIYGGFLLPYLNFRAEIMGHVGVEPTTLTLRVSCSAN